MKPHYITTSTLAFLLLLLLLASSYLQTSMAGSGRDANFTCIILRRQVQGEVLEGERAGSVLRYCGLCCAECNCVPSGTYGNKDECPCYRDKYTGTGLRRRPKCP
uniref:Uncharacterized protein n=1 Tax=Ananas comosus var. bracteatus TaxID=296719 RepID=A0A6V7NLK6_ANACO|nr:unnamed protein product [Ananas comosus var. bracteatus]